MSVGFGGVLGSAAGAPLSQSTGAETERAQKDSLAQSRHSDAKHLAERAAGIGETQQDEQSSERDADGRRLWEREDSLAREPSPPVAEADPRQSKDATGQSGTQLDLSG